MRKKLMVSLASRFDAKSIAIMSRDLIEIGLDWTWTPKRILRSIMTATTNVLVCRDNQTVIGFSIMDFDEDQAHLSLLAVHPKYQRLGIGRHLVAWQEKSALVAGISVVYLEVRATNQIAQNFYLRLGYQKVKPLKCYYRGNENAILMARDLWLPAPSHAK